MTVPCPTCGKPAVPEKFCGSCGSRVPQPEEQLEVPQPEGQSAQPAPVGPDKRRPVGWPLLALAAITAVLVACAAYSVLRPSEVSLAQVASRANNLTCTSETAEVRISDGSWKYTEADSGDVTGKYDVSGDEVTVSAQTASGDVWDLKVSGLSGVYLSLDTPVSIKYGESESMIRPGSASASGPAGRCSRG